jgi:hypothetical protein
MYLAITDGTTTVVLSGTSPVQGVTYFPASPATRDGELQPVTETAQVNLRGTAAAIRASVNAVEGLLRLARERQATGVGVRVFVLYRPVDADSASYRSEIYDGRVVWSDNPGLRRLGDTNPPAQVAVIWTRAPWWEGDEAELSISATAQAAATGGRTINNDPANGNWVQAAAAQVAGVLPAPLRVHLINNTGSTQNYRRVMLGVNAYSDPANFVHYLQGEARLSGGSNTADATSSGGALLEFTASSSPTTFQWTLPQADMQRSNGRRFRVLGRFEATAGPLYVRPDIRTSGGVVLWQGDELALGTLLYESWQDFGVVPLLPGGYNALYGAARLGLTFRGAGSVYLDVLQLTSLDSYRHIEMVGTGVATANGAALIHDGIEGQTYTQGGGVRTPVPASFGGPLLAQPGLINRLYVLHQVNAGGTAGAGDAPIAASMSVRLYYRPRRVTV